MVHNELLMQFQADVLGVPLSGRGSPKPRSPAPAYAARAGGRLLEPRSTSRGKLGQRPRVAAGEDPARRDTGVRTPRKKAVDGGRSISTTDRIEKEAFDDQRPAGRRGTS